MITTIIVIKPKKARPIPELNPYAENMRPKISKIAPTTPIPIAK